MPRTHHRITALVTSLGLAFTGLVATGATLAPASASPATPAAAPGTLVFIKNHDVWMAKGDGSGQVRITKDGTAADKYSQPSMPRAGVIAAIKGKSQIVQVRTDGAVLSSWDSKTLVPVGTAIDQRTTSVDFSPDGAKAAYGQYAFLGLGSSEVGTRFSAASQLTTAAPQQLDFSDAKWITNSRVLLRNKGGLHLYDVGATGPQEWFQEKPYFHEPGDDYYINEDLFDPELSADGTRLVTMRGPNYDPTLLFFSVAGNARTSVPAPPTLTCQLESTDGYNPDNPTISAFSDPTIAPNSRTVAWEDARGIYVKDNIAVCSRADVRLLIAGGSDPSWSAVAYKAPTPAPKPVAPKTFKSTKAPAISGTAKVGKTLKVTKGTWSPAPTKTTYQWKRNGKAIKGATKATYKVKKADAGTKITATVTVTRTSYTKASKTSKAKAVALLNTKKPKIAKKPAAKVGKTLKVTKGTWKTKPKKITYQWYRGKKAIKGATKAKYKLTKADRGKKIRVKVTAQRTGYPKTAVYTTYTKKVK